MDESEAHIRVRRVLLNRRSRKGLQGEAGNRPPLFLLRIFFAIRSPTCCGHSNSSPGFARGKCCVLETERLTLRRPTLADVKAIAHLANDRRIRKYPPPAAPLFAGPRGGFVRATSSDSSETVFLIEQNHSPVGMVGIDRSAPDVPELGYSLGVAHWGQGFGTEAARALIDFF